MISAIIVAAGKGTRMGPGIDKIFLEVAAKPVIVHTWQHLNSTKIIDEIVLVIREGMEPSFSDLAKEYQFTKPFRLVAGGPERQDSVWNGLQALSSEADIVAIQDGARPCTSREVITATIAAAREIGAAVAAQRVTDTIKASEDGIFIGSTLDRSRLWAVQTPQSFRVEIIRRALAVAREQGLILTDDAAACELIGQKVKLVASATPNPKVTMPGDLPYIESLLRR
jgi:2-C-methyl-D-erythritol 4-phosphate cytidylyltransferase